MEPASPQSERQIADDVRDEIPLSPVWIEEVARAFHWQYERIAAEKGWATQERSRVDWDDLPPENRETMLATVKAVFEYSGNLWVEIEWCHHRNMPLYSLRARTVVDEHSDGDVCGWCGRPGPDHPYATCEQSDGAEHGD